MNAVHYSGRIYVLFFVSILFFILKGSLCQMTWQPCDTTARPLSIPQVTLTPDPPIIGGSATFKVDALSGESFVGA